MAIPKLAECFVLRSYPFPSNYPKGFVQIMHYLPMLTIPLVSLGLFCIIKLSPPGITTGYKGLLISYTVWTAVMELSFSTLIVPVLLFPAIGFYCVGVLSELGVHTGIQISFDIMSLIATSTVIEQQFYYRMNTLNSGFSKYHLSDRTCSMWNIMWMFDVVVLVPTVMCVLFVNIDQEPHKEAISQLFPQLKEELDYPGTIAYFLQTDWIFFLLCAVVLAIAVFHVLSVIGCIATSFHLIHQRKSTMSHQTWALSKNFLMSLIAQAGTHSLFLGVPMTIFVVQISFNIYWRELTQVLTFIFSMHSSMGLIALLVVTKVYRRRAVNIAMTVWALVPNFRKELRRGSHSNQRRNAIAPSYISSIAIERDCIT